MLLWVYIHTGQAWKICLTTVGIEPTTFLPGKLITSIIFTWVHYTNTEKSWLYMNLYIDFGCSCIYRERTSWVYGNTLSNYASSCIINNFKNMPWILTLSEQRKLLVKKDLILLIIIFGKACFTIARLQSYIVTEIKWCFMWRVRFLKRTMKSYLVLNYFRPVFSIINQNN
jgi:hypothetical protein